MIYRRVLEIDPRNADATHLLGLVAHACGRPDAAAELLGRSLAIRPHAASVYSVLGVVLQSLGRHDDAAAACRQAIKLDPDHVGARNNLGAILRTQGDLDEAIGWFETALKRDPNHADTVNNLALAYKDAGLIDEAIRTARRGAELSPISARAHSNVLLMLHYQSGYDPDAVFREHLDWGTRLTDELGTATDRQRAPQASHPSNRDPNRQLRVGFVSPDFWAHPVAYFIEPLLAARDPTQIKTFCYADAVKADAITQRLHGFADEWRSVAGLADKQLDQTIRADQIDILVDLSGHTGQNRLSLFARKPAPIQVTYLGYCDTTGLPAMDYLLTDEIADPPGEASRYTEKLIRLPGGFSCFAPPPAASSPDFAGDPDGPVTFGAMPVLAKLNHDVIDSWARILRAAGPGARLLLYRNTLRGQVRQRFIREFVSRGIDTGRLDFRCDIDPSTLDPALAGRWHLPLYRQIDIALDTFPWSGHTSACEALWMGAPVVSLRGNTHVGRMVASVLNQIDRYDLMAETREEYTDKAVELSRHASELRAGRSALRDSMRQSRLCDSNRFAREFASALRRMWGDWCASEK